ncbi:ABC transporter B family member 5 [Nosema granulosis]|uniref:ABC transporter B family member 5 n=1 Tax=Nosema granulosis TaxID=83296 RepID=A0A9P6KZ74_9MICR|nr:ABC transporter B family member 5 [Nosema granulosis]
MEHQTKNKTLTNWKILSLCVKYYLSEMNGTFLILSTIVLSVITRRFLNYVIKKSIYSINASSSIVTDIFKIYILSFVYSSLSALNDYILKTFNGVFQMKISIKALHHILKTESMGKIDLTSGKTQFAISEGSKAMSKLFKYLFVEIITKFTYLATDISLIHTRLGWAHVGFALLIAAISTIIHIKGAMITMECKKQLNEARGQCDKNVYEDIINFETIKAYQTENEQIGIYKKKMDPWKNAFLRHARVTIFLAFIHDVIFATTALGFNLFFWYKSESKQERFKDSYLCLRDLEQTIENISTMYRKYRESLVTSSMLIYYLDSIEGFSSGSTVKNRFIDRISFKKVDYKFKDISVLKEIDFELVLGDKKVIYGRNGSGKSTIFRLIMRLATPNSGTISIDGIDINQINMNDYRKLFTYVPQETNLFDDTIFNNLVYGNNKSFHRVIEECKKMNIHEDIIKLENGYNTVVGERGNCINGGLRQKIFYCRALLTDAPIFLFDEPTNNLDESSSNMLISLILGDPFKDKTVLVICHDHELVQRFPKVLNFVDGVLKETRNE